MIVLEQLQYLEPVQPGHDMVEENDVGLVVPEHFQCKAAIGGRLHHDIKLVQLVFEHRCGGFGIVNNQGKSG